ncbi:TPA: YcaO-like family protein [Streptococcus suis]|nr:YcaO-like family protein [Streptococcus suis]
MSVTEFTSDDFLFNFDISVFAPSTCKYGDLIEVNRKLYKYNKPYVLFNFTGESYSVGPMVLPTKSSCLECNIAQVLKNMNVDLSEDEKLEFKELIELTFSHDVSVESCQMNESVITYLCDIIYREISKQLNYSLSELVNCQFYFALDSLAQEKVEILPTTCCDFCNGANSEYIKISDENQLLQYMKANSVKLVHNSVKYKTGGVRSKTESETKALLEKELNKLGSKITIEFDENNPFKDIVPSYIAQFERTDESGFYFPKSESGAGKGITMSQAYFSAGFEIIEHITREYTGDIPIVAAKYKDIKNYAIDMPYLASTIMNRNTYYSEFNEDSEIDWVIANSVIDSEKKLIPAFLVFMHDVDLKGTMFGTASTGVASGATLEDAILHGLFEVIEHDAWMIGQANPFILPTVNYESSKNPKIKEIVHAIEDMGYEIVTRDYTNDLKVPVFRTYITNRKNFSQYSYNGIGCHVSPEIALERSITEAMQFCDPLFGGIESSLVTNNVLATSMVSLYNQHHVINKDVLGKSDKVTQIVNSLFEFKSSYDLIQQLAALVKERIGGDIYFVDLTKKGMDIKVVRVVVTGEIQRLNHPILSASNRLFEFGIRCGYSNEPISYEELFMGDYQH